MVVAVVVVMPWGVVCKQLAKGMLTSSKNAVSSSFSIHPPAVSGGGCGAIWSNEMKNCTPLWHEENFEVHVRKIPQRRSTSGWKLRCGKSARRCRTKTFRSQNVENTPFWSTFGSWEVEKAHAVLARSRFRSQNVQSTPFSEHCWKLRCGKSARRSGAKQISKSKCTKHTILGALLEVEMWKKCTPLWRGAHPEVKMCKTHHSRSTFGSWEVGWKTCTPLWREAYFEVNTLKARHARTIFGRWSVFVVGGAKDSAPRQKWANRDCFVAVPKTLAGVGHLKRICKDAFSVAGAVQETCSSNVRGSGRWFPERGCILEHRIFRFAKMILRDRCSTSYDLASLFHGTRSTLNRWNGKIAKRIGTTRPSALHSTFQFWRKSRRIALVLMLSTSKIEDASQNCCVFDVVTLSSSKTQEISQTCCVFDVATLSSSKTQEVSHNCCVFDVVTFKNSGTLAE